MRWIGARSYGIYLWHFPIIVLTASSASSAPSGVRTALQVAATFAVAALSWRYVEDPIRHGALGRLWERWRASAGRERFRLTPVGGAIVAGCLLVAVPAVAGFAGVGATTRRTPADDDISVTKTVTAPADDDATDETVPPTGDEALGPCTAVVHVGGSTSLGLVSSSYIPDEQDQIPAQYTAAGVTTQHYEIAGGRAIIESYRENPDARTSAQRWRDEGYEGCWVFVLGTMDAANVSVGSPVGFAERIDDMMQIADGDPVLWVNVKTVKGTGPWRAENMPPWNAALLEACARHPNLRIYDWAADVQDDWFSSDGIHNNTEGYIARARNIPQALVAAFPGSGEPAVRDGCVVDRPATGSERQAE
jgi:hypothetical protein